MSEARVAIFWVVNGIPLVDSTQLSQGEDYGEFKIHSGDHYSVWERFQQSATVPADMEYEEAPRGRVVYNTKTRRFALLADKCILNDSRVLRLIISELHLPASTLTGTDDHYRCFRCLTPHRSATKS
jgi:hypothetical protein